MKRFIFATFMLVPTPALAEDILVFAAASLRGALEEIVVAWEGSPVVASYAGSATLARQIQAGAPADIFISANAAWMDVLAAEEMIRTQAVIAGNRLVLAGADVTLGTWPEALIELPSDARIATGFVAAVPVGIYAWQALEASGLAEATLPHLVQTENVRLALSLAARGEVDRAIVYATDAIAEPGVAIAAEIPTDLHDPIEYPAGLLTNADHPDAQRFFDFLNGPNAAAILSDHGFEVAG